MLLRTHVATALSLTYMFDYYIQLGNHAYAENIIARVIVYATSVVLQYLIDQIGHTWKKYGKHAYPARNKYHSLPAMLGLGGVIGLLYYLVTGVEELVVLFASVMLLHWVEDLVTESGVYLFGRRIRLPFRVRYDNGAVNRVAILVLIVAATIYTNPFHSIITFVFYMMIVVVSAYSFLTS